MVKRICVSLSNENYEYMRQKELSPSNELKIMIEAHKDGRKL